VKQIRPGAGGRWDIEQQKSVAQPADVLTSPLQRLVIGALEDMKAVDRLVFDVRTRTNVTDCMHLVSGNSARHVKSIAEHVVEKAREAGIRPLGVEGEDVAEWVLVDLGDAVIHVMLPRVRELYRLERIWGVDDGSAAGDDADPEG
jgi:ribosome-associated protein